MNYLKNRYPFKLITHIFRMATRPSETLQNSVEVKRNKSDSAVSKHRKEKLNEEKQSSEENVSKKLSSSVSEWNVAKKCSGHRLKTAESSTSLPVSKTSSEHSLRGILERKKTPLNLKLVEAEQFQNSPKKEKNSLNRELRYKLQKLQRSLENSVTSSREVLSEEDTRPKLKRAYPWQNFNLNAVPKTESEEDVTKTLPRGNRLVSSSSNESMLSLCNSSLANRSSNQSLKSFMSASSMSIEAKRSTGSLQEVKDQMPLFKSILKKSAQDKARASKEVTFNNISTIYGPNSTYSSVVRQPKTNLSTSTQQSDMMKSINASVVSKVRHDNETLKGYKKNKSKHSGDVDSLGKYEPLKEENSFLYLFNGKRQKIH